MFPMNTPLNKLNVFTVTSIPQKQISENRRKLREERLRRLAVIDSTRQQIIKRTIE
jgi:hypothetical protein